MTTATATHERPILFSGAMVRALLAGTKTQTRRLMKPQYGTGEVCEAAMAPGSGPSCNQWAIHDATGYHKVKCPQGVVGDRLWVRETVAIESWSREYGDEPPLPTDRPWKHLPPLSHEDCDYWLWPHYRATDPTPDLSCERENCRTCENGGPGPHWRPSIHMPRWASRITLEITDVRVQRLHDISQDDARAEGVDGSGNSMHSAVADFAALWCRINGGKSWDANPWVWALSFKRSTP